MGETQELYPSDETGVELGYRDRGQSKSRINNRRCGEVGGNIVRVGVGETIGDAEKSEGRCNSE